MDIHLEHPFDAPVETVFAMLTDPEFLRARLDATPALEHELLECEATPDGGFHVVTQRTVQADIPGFAKKIFKPTNTLTQIEDWLPASGDTREGTWRVETKGVPVSTSGETRIEPAGAASVFHILGKIKVSVPLLGGRLEHFVFDQAKETMDIEHDFGKSWLAARA